MSIESTNTLTAPPVNTEPVNTVQSTPAATGGIAMDRLTLRELRRLQADLEEEITRQQKAARRHALESIDRLIAEAELTAEEVIAHLRPQRKRKRAKLPAKFRDPENPGNSWAGRGKKPRWLAAKLEAGAKLGDFRVESSEGSGGAPVRRGAAKATVAGTGEGRMPPAASGTSPEPLSGPAVREVAR